MATDLNLSQFETSKEMFCEIENITNIDLSTFDTQSVTNMGNMFSGASALNTITYGDNFIHKENSTTSSMFNNCPANKPTHLSWEGVS